MYAHHSFSQPILNQNLYLQAVLKFIMLRRSKDDTVNGKTILDLPPKIIQVVKCDFSTDERRFYRTLEAKMAGELERLTKTEDNRSYMHMLTLLLRMRQGGSARFILRWVHR